MADHEFETQLERLFSEQPNFSDSEAFSRRVEHRLAVGWQWRNLVIGAAGLGGGSVAVGQIASMQLFANQGALYGQGAHQAYLSATKWSLEHWTVLFGAYAGLPFLPFGGEAIWMSAGLMALAFGFALTRLLEEV